MVLVVILMVLRLMSLTFIIILDFFVQVVAELPLVREPLYNVPSLRYSEEILWHLKKMDMSYTHAKSS
jgi:hypothetical protein